MVEKRLKVDKLFSTFKIRDFKMLTSFWLLSSVLLLHQRTCVPLAMVNELRFASTCSYVCRDAACKCVHATMCTSMESFVMD